MTQRNEARAIAELIGAKLYSTGVPCAHGHVAERYVSTNSCVECNRQATKASKRRARERDPRPRPDLCECCGGLPTGRGQFHFDHDHETGAFRGWLCSKCNQGIGLLGDTVQGVERAINYLKGIKHPDAT